MTPKLSLDVDRMRRHELLGMDRKLTDFEFELRALINRCGIDSLTEIADHRLAALLRSVVKAMVSDA